MNRLDRIRRRELEQELRDVPTSPPPADLLDRIQADIPQHLTAANEGDGAPSRSSRRPWHRTPLFRMAASIAVVTLGVTLAWRTLDERSAQEAVSAPPVQKLEYRAADAETKRTVEAGPSIEQEAASKGSPDDRFASTSSAGERANVATPSMEGAPAAPVGAVALAGNEAAKVVSESAPVARQDAPGRGRDLDELRSLQDESRSALRESQPAPSAAAPVSADREAGRDQASQAVEENITVIGEAPATTDTSAVGAGVPAPKPQERRREKDESSRLAKSKKAPEPLPDTGATVSAETLRQIPVVAGAPPSTGGTAEPNDQPVGDMFFRPAGTNPFVDTAEDPLSTFALDVDTGSYALARSYLERGALPPTEAIRVEEFVNAQRYDDPAPRRGEFTLVAEGAPSPFAPAVSNDRYRLVRFAVKAREILPEERKSAVLTFVVDVSGSMNRENRLGLVKRALGLMLDELGPDDRVALVVYGSQGRVLLGHTRDHEAIREAISRLVPEGSTNAEEGLRLGYRLAGEAYRSGSINRVILCSDGVANVGATGPESILATIGESARHGIELTTVGFGMGNYNDALMEQLADQGDGAYHYVDSLDEARKVFVENLTGMLQTVAKDAKVQVEFERGAVERWRLLGYENRDVADRDFRNDAVDAGEIGVGHAATALYEIRLAPGVRSNDRLATLRLRWKSVETGRVIEAEQTLRARDLGRSFERAGRDLRVAAVAAELAERLKKSYWAKDTSWSALSDEVRRLERDFPRDESVATLADLVRRAATLAGNDEPAPRPGGPLDDAPSRR